MNYCLEMRSTADWQDCRYRDYTRSAKKAEAFRKVPRIDFTDSGHGIVPVVTECTGRTRGPLVRELAAEVRDALTPLAFNKPRRRSRKEWMPVATLPPPGERPGRVFVLVQGTRHHHGNTWVRQNAGIAATENDGFNPGDIFYIETGGDMDADSGVVTHWLPIDLPNYPRAQP